VTEIFRVEIIASAEQDIEEIWKYIACDNSQDTSLFIINLEELFLTLESFPFRCPAVPENELLGTNYRHLPNKNYRIIFRIIDIRVIIMRLLH
jgi:toxin ParE1/3/4